MTSLELLFRHPLIPPLGWALVHFLWQGALIAGLLAIGLRLRDPRGAPLLRSAEARYLAACIALFVMAACPVITLAVSLPAPSHSEWLLPAHVPAPPDLSPAGSHAVSLPRLSAPLAPDTNGQTATSGAESLLPVVVIAWLLGVLALSVRLLGGWIAVQRLRCRGTRPIHGPIADRFLELARRMRIDRPVLLLESPMVSVPTVIGWLRAAVLVPVGALSGLPPGHLEAVLAHELAHIRRNDYLVNLLQTAAEVLLFYHPAVWWVSRYIRRERENCCDDLAVAFLGDRLAYARALTALEELRHAPGSLALAANSGDLLTRIRRVLGLPPISPGPSVTGVGGMIVITLILAAAVLQASTAVPASSSADASHPAVRTATASTPRPATPMELEHRQQARQRLRAVALAEQSRLALLKRNWQEAVQAEQARQASLQRARLEGGPAGVPPLAGAQPVKGQTGRPGATQSARVQTAASSQKPRQSQTGSASKGMNTTKSGDRMASAASPAEGAAPGTKAAPAGANGVVKGVSGPSIEDVPVLDLRGVPASQVARIRSIKDVGVLLLDTKNRGALSGASLEDVGATVVASPNARVLVDPFIEFSRVTLEGMPARQDLILVGVAVFKPDVTPALVTQKLGSLNVTGVLLATAGVRGALLGRMQITGTSATLPDDAGPVAHSIGDNQFTTGYLSRLPDRSVYVNVGAVEIAPDVTEELLAQKIGTYVNIGATIGRTPLLDRLKSVSVTNVGTFTEEKKDGDKHDE